MTTPIVIRFRDGEIRNFPSCIYKCADNSMVSERESYMLLCVGSSPTPRTNKENILEENYIIYSFDNGNGTFDFVKITQDLHELLCKKNAEEIFIESYTEDRVEGIIELLTRLGVSKSSVITNLQILPELDKELSNKILNRQDSEHIDGFPHEEDILYN